MTTLNQISADHVARNESSATYEQAGQSIKTLIAPSVGASLLVVTTR
jgi:hypothetical protein